jgi:hypothetical protein
MLRPSYSPLSFTIAVKVTGYIDRARLSKGMENIYSQGLNSVGVMIENIPAH